MSRFLISCGGTGGHLSPGIALAEGLVDRGHAVRILVSRKRVDARLIEKYANLEFDSIPGAGFSLRPSELARFLSQQALGFLKSVRLMRRFRPDAVVGFGGFTSAAFIAAGAMTGIPVVLHEANRIPGRAIRLMGRFARRVYLPAGVRLSSLSRNVVREAGLPVRREFKREDAREARLQLGLEESRPVVAVLGGSQGATALNDWARCELGVLGADGVQVYCVTGLGKGAPERIEIVSAAGDRVRHVFAPFCDRMATLLSATDLVVSRAGAGTLAELVRIGTPAVLIPFPFAADNHQDANADYFLQQGCGEVVSQDRLHTLTERVRSLLTTDGRRALFRSNLERLDRVDPLPSMITDLEEIVHRDKRGATLLPGTLGLA
ncbi:MAG: UDP-N-acetylglucosamine--N-acetylmuramyl-(pentapeptide) pyrophosphoryl-undecaprenol N-acetylglucosamine transferase [Opitutaceae bacterium]|nr:UDP-N-acetylglucosamine--N-acetylmuramyl-(pentapeptide) pyrophosphoryl-undecaprenol N-acetylglucosamine transferase [Opitutaceae bacterium]